MLVFFSIFRTFGGEPPSRARDVPCAIGIRREGRSYVSQTMSLINFKNIGQEEFPLTPGINCFVGDNGAGKTNFIDAIHYLSMCKSAFSMTCSQSVHNGEEFFLLEGSYERSDGRGEQIVCSFARRGGKTLKRNGKEYDRLSDHVGLVPVVIVSPADTALVSDAADERRRYLNGCISQLDRGYLSAVMRYNAVLSERNRYLKVGSDEDMLSIWTGSWPNTGRRSMRSGKRSPNGCNHSSATYYALLSVGATGGDSTYRYGTRRPYGTRPLRTYGCSRGRRPATYVVRTVPYRTVPTDRPTVPTDRDRRSSSSSTYVRSYVVRTYVRTVRTVTVRTDDDVRTFVVVRTT